MIESLRIAALFCACAFLLVTVVQRVGDRQEDLAEQNKAWIDNASTRSQNSMVTRLFESAVQHGIITYDARDDMIRIATEREYAVNIRNRTEQPAKPPLLDREATIKLLWRNAGAGPEVRAEIARHQKQRRIIAVRDGAVTPFCRVEGDENSCEQPPWRIQPYNVDLSLEGGGSGAVGEFPEWGVFRSLARLYAPTPTAWTSVARQDLGEMVYQLSPTELKRNRYGTAIIDLIGQDLVMSGDLDGKVEVVAFCIPTDPDTVRMRIEVCSEIERSDDDAIAYQISMDAKDWRDQSYVLLSMAEIPSVPPSLRQAIRNSNVPVPDDGSGTLERRIDDRFLLSCDAEACKPEIRASNQLRRVSTDLVIERFQKTIAASEAESTEGTAPAPDLPDDVLTLQESVALLDSPFVELDQDGRVTTTTASNNLGLQPMLGISDLNNASYLFFLENLPASIAASDLRLTFDTDLQQQTMDVFRAALETKTLPLRGSFSKVPDNDRRAAFALVDLQEGPGAVLATVSYPFFDPKLPLWDLNAVATGSDANSPATPAAWKGLDVRFMPGSSLKIVSALSMIRSAIGMTEGVDPDQQDILTASVFGAQPDLYQGIGVDITQTSLLIEPSRPLRGARPLEVNDFNPNLAPFTFDPSVERSCESSGLALDFAGQTKNYGICEAIARSSNIFFSGMALFENRAQIDVLYDKAVTPRFFTGLGQTLVDLGLHDSLALAKLSPGIDANDTFAPRMDRPFVDSARGLGQPDGPDFREDFHERNVAINSYGQNVQITPLAMATIAGSIALNQKLRPFIVESAEALTPLPDPVLPNSDLAQAMLRELRLGMRAVVRPGGTGYLAFGHTSDAAKALRPRVAGKTGSATLGLRDENGVNIITHWFVGWVDDANGRPKYAFACAISHIANGGACPSVVGAVMAELQAAGRL